MTTKGNDATLNRPEGERLLDAPLMRMSLQEHIRQLQDEKAWQQSDRNAITLVHSAEMKVVLIALKEGADMPAHDVNGYALLQVLDGRIWMETEVQSISLDAGEAAAMQPHLQHSIHAEAACVLLLTIAERGAAA